MATSRDLKSSLFQTNSSLIVRRANEECHAILYNDDKNIVIANGMQGELIYWFSLRFTPLTYQEVFNYLETIYEVSSEQLHTDLELSLRKIIELKLITEVFPKENIE